MASSNQFNILASLWDDALDLSIGDRSRDPAMDDNSSRDIQSMSICIEDEGLHFADAGSDLICSSTLNPTIFQPCNFSTLAACGRFVTVVDALLCEFSHRRGDADVLLTVRLSPTPTICSAHCDFSKKKNPTISHTDVGFALLIVRLPSSTVDPRWPAWSSNFSILFCTICDFISMPNKA
ncbi:hypothetical protein U1Q18_005835 [Sarracenia purpurea var. burkii]